LKNFLKVDMSNLSVETALNQFDEPDSRGNRQ